MTSDDHTDGRRADEAGPGGVDPIREFLLGVAAQIDQLAGLIAGPRAATSAGTERVGLEVPGEITTLLTEIGDLIARLIAAVIAVLEAIATALRSTPGPGESAGPDQRYEPIAVRIDVGAATRTPVGEPEGDR
ncbi:hypothetical protein [Gordonia soli]|uniref:Uncharacterized protein n=1 Tax=Gordonia soli NBRC 108243 TaxID=1223545 RepID=M0QLJ4_9ACTN|nr:hypothetical protein [Gordonia soli]GAC69530.1 hypothetical protein GS4_25_01020 [Gordonia soli NBRC 108243]